MPILPHPQHHQIKRQLAAERLRISYRRRFRPQLCRNREQMQLPVASCANCAPHDQPANSVHPPKKFPNVPNPAAFAPVKHTPAAACHHPPTPTGTHRVHEIASCAAAAIRLHARCATASASANTWVSRGNISYLHCMTRNAAMPDPNHQKSFPPPSAPSHLQGIARAIAHLLPNVASPGQPPSTPPSPRRNAGTANCRP